MRQRPDEEYDGEAWGNDKTARTAKYLAQKKKTRPEGTRLHNPPKHARPKVPILDDLEDYYEYEPD